MMNTNEIVDQSTCIMYTILDHFQKLPFLVNCLLGCGKKEEQTVRRRVFTHSHHILVVVVVVLLELLLYNI